MELNDLEFIMTQCHNLLYMIKNNINHQIEPDFEYYKIVKRNQINITKDINLLERLNVESLIQYQKDINEIDKIYSAYFSKLNDRINNAIKFNQD